MTQGIDGGVGGGLGLENHETLALVFCSGFDFYGGLLHHSLRSSAEADPGYESDRVRRFGTDRSRDL